jgi:hypothetical protein
VRRVHGLAVTSLLTGLLAGLPAGLLALVLTVTMLPAVAAPVPGRYLTLYRQAARTCPGLSWPVLAGIGTVESDNGRSRARGVHRGKNRKGAEGPMQFEPATFAEYAVRAGRGGKPNPYDAKDAIFTAARMLCANGAARGPRGLRGAIYAYNHACWYVREVLALAVRYARRPARKREYRQAAALCANHHKAHGYDRKHGARTTKGHHHRRRPGRGRHRRSA